MLYIVKCFIYFFWWNVGNWKIECSKNLIMSRWMHGKSRNDKINLNQRKLAVAITGELI